MQYAVTNSDLYDPTIDNLTPFIKDSGIQALHTTPQMAYDAGLITDTMIAEYKMYAVVRHPNVRAASAFQHTLRPASATASRVKRMLKARGFEALPSIFRRPQMDWFTINDKQVVTPILYDNYNVEFTALYNSMGADITVEKKNVGSDRAVKAGEIFKDREFAKLSKVYYAADWKLYRMAKNTDFADRD